MPTGYGDPKISLDPLEIRSYIDGAVMPVLIESLQKLTEEKPPNPIEFIAKYLLENNP